MQKEQAKPWPVLLWSGGPDALFALRELGYPDNAVLLHVPHGQRGMDLDRDAALRTAHLLGYKVAIETSLSMGHVERGSDSILPMRNIMLASVASWYGDNIVLGVLRDEVNSDKRQDVLSDFASVCTRCYERGYWCEGRTITVSSPIRQYFKHELLARFLDSDSARRIYLSTRSCYHGYYRQCGECSSCLKRWLSEQAAVEQELSRYRKDPSKSAAADKMREHVAQGLYTDARAELVRRYLC